MSLTQTRELVLSTLYERVRSATFASPVSGSTTFRTTGRRLRHFADVSMDSRPCMFMVCHGENPTWQSENSNPYVKFDVKLFVYLNTKDEGIVGDTDINVILDAIDDVLKPPARSSKFTLGGLVSHCRVDGETLRDPGDLDGDGIIIVPISITLT